MRRKENIRVDECRELDFFNERLRRKDTLTKARSYYNSSFARRREDARKLKISSSPFVTIDCDKKTHWYI